MLSKLAIFIGCFITQFSCKPTQLPQVSISTSLGEILVEVDTINAPITAKNFLSLVEEGTYDKKASFYRAVHLNNQPNNKVKIEVIQGGLQHDLLILRIPPIPHETTKHTGLKHTNGVISMARSEPGSASSEIFICIGDQPELDFGGKRNPDGQGFAAFGKVIKGMDVVKQIQQISTDKQYLEKPVLIEKIKVH